MCRECRPPFPDEVDLIVDSFDCEAPSLAGIDTSEIENLIQLVIERAAKEKK